MSNKTFDDLMYIAKKAVEDGVLGAFLVNDNDHSNRIGNVLYIGLNMTDHGIANEIEYIDSLYTETFMIESEEDLDKINCNADIKLLNGMHIETSGSGAGGYVSYFSEESANNYVDFIFLKGATVTQQKGNK